MPGVLLGLGANLGDRAATLSRAVRVLAQTLAVRSVSSLYESAPMYVEDQPAFFNLALAAETTLDPRALLVLAKDVENQLGRIPGRRFGPRTADIDILAYGDRVVAERDLVIPHPRLAERAFVLLPLAEIVPDQLLPGLGRSIAELLQALPAEARAGVSRLSLPRPADWIAG